MRNIMMNSELKSPEGDGGSVQFINQGKQTGQMNQIDLERRDLGGARAYFLLSSSNSVGKIGGAGSEE